MLENKKIFIIGLAKSGYECAKLLNKYNNEITIIDSNNEDKNIDELKKMGINVIICSKDEQPNYLDKTYNLVVRNPGVPLNAPIVIKAQDLEIPITTEVEVAYNYLPKNTKIVAISGSNGKTTTTTMIYEILKKANMPVHLGGNIGYPVTSLVERVKENDILVLEISDHQLVNMKNFRANIAILTNIVESHIDFHGTFEKYIATKRKLFNNQTSNDLAIINKDNEISLNITSDILSKKIYFSTKENAEIKLENDNIYYNNELIMNTSQTPLIGVHNYENIMAAIATVKEFNIDNKIIIDYLKTFGGVEHRVEFVKEINGVSYYNDAKSTNTAATITALKSFDGNIHLILGGLDRGHSFDEIAEFKSKITFIYAYGECKERIKDFAIANDINCLVFDRLEDVMVNVFSNVNQGSKVLFSPACASWDQYNKFEERGEEFKQLINKLDK